MGHLAECNGLSETENEELIACGDIERALDLVWQGVNELGLLRRS